VTKPDETTGASDVSRLSDSQEIAQLTAKLGATLDEKRPEDLRQVFAPDVQFQFGDNLVSGVGEIVKRGQMLAGKFARVHHVITNVIVDLDGDSARVRAQLVATHGYWDDRPDLHFDSGGIYRFEVTRLAEGWRISKASLQNVWTNGSWEAPPKP